MHQKGTLTEKRKEYFKELLNNTLDGLLSQRKKNTSQIEYLKSESGDFTDHASAETDSVLNVRIRERRDKLIKKINDALRRFEDGTFGICEECGQEISEKRLIARPTATMCIGCKEKQEAEENTGSMMYTREFYHRENDFIDG